MFVWQKKQYRWACSVITTTTGTVTAVQLESWCRHINKVPCCCIQLFIDPMVPPWQGSHDVITSVENGCNLKKWVKCCVFSLFCSYMYKQWIVRNKIEQLSVKCLMYMTIFSRYRSMLFFSHKGDIFLTMLLFFFSVLNRVLEPTVLMEMTLSDGNIHTFEVRDLPLLCLTI